MKWIIETIPHKEQRYETLGDYRVDGDGNYRVFVSETGDDNYNFLIGLHEQIEFWLTKQRGISEEAITKFDMDHPELSDPGENKKAPYYQEHREATIHETLMAYGLGVDWEDYGARLEKVANE